MYKLLFFVILLTMSSCASLNQVNEHKKLVDNFKQHKFKEVIKDIKEKKLLTKPKDRFLKSLQLGIAYFRDGDYLNALAFLDDAKQVATQLYTVRASKKIESFLLSDANDIYYPNPVELSLIRFYELISHLILSEDPTNQNRKFNRMAIETTLRDWHAYRDNMSVQKLGEAVFKGTILPDVMGYIFHDYLGGRQDRTKVKNFKAVALKNLKQRMGIYPSFNKKHKAYKDDFEKLHLIPDRQLMKKYIGKTSTYKNVESFFKTKANTYVLILEGMGNSKSPKKYDIPLDFMRVVAPVGNKKDFASFSMQMMSISSVGNAKIYFELPQVKAPKVSEPKSYQLDAKSGNVTMVANLSEILSQVLSEESAAVKAKIASKLVVKHLALLATSYLTYKSLKKQNEFIAYASAAASYAVGNKSLQALEKADLRSWVGIHNTINVIPLNLSSGKHILSYKGKQYSINKEGRSKQIVPLFIN